MTIDQLEAEALKLSEPDRARLAQRLIASLDADSEIEQAWYDEAERRLSDLESGDAAEIPASEVFESLGLGGTR
ncbi:MAG: addiction module protein [Gemmatimonadetes bacterium]|nr:addiction module protein [Gemmatimonadota bacterium]